ncbi:MAG: hypothetical protein QG627_1050 [Chlamydiota bacterium]|nr:hypothetical protein [Chlamydiota bacterium]
MRFKSMSTICLDITPKREQGEIFISNPMGRWERISRKTSLTTRLKRLRSWAFPNFLETVIPNLESRPCER